MFKQVEFWICKGSVHPNYQNMFMSCDKTIEATIRESPLALI